MSIDLHVHSVNSDGTDSTEAIIESSIELQLEAICISDHEYLTKVPQQNNIEIIPVSYTHLTLPTTPYV